jgi:WD40 repeat protein
MSQVIKVRSQRNLVVPVTCAAYSPSGDWVAAGAQDGSIQLFNMKKTSWMRADILIRPGASLMRRG